MKDTKTRRLQEKINKLLREIQIYQFILNEIKIDEEDMNWIKRISEPSDCLKFESLSEKDTFIFSLTLEEFLRRLTNNPERK